MTVGDLYAVLCKALRIEPQSQSERQIGVVRESCRAVVQADRSAWAREYVAWRQSAWTSEDVWATLVWNIIDAYGLNLTVVSPGDDTSGIAKRRALQITVVTKAITLKTPAGGF